MVESQIPLTSSTFTRALITHWFEGGEALIRNIRRTVVLAAAVIVGVLLAPASVFAQSTIAGVVTDSSGAVLPGVTVEAASPVLIEKMRAGVTDSQGRYALVDLRPGTYLVTFTLAGFR